MSKLYSNQNNNSDKILMNLKNKSIIDIVFEFIKDNKDGIYRVLSVAGIILIFAFLNIECFFQRFLNIPCLGCGMTRAWKSVLRGDFSQAFEYHKAYLTIPIIFIYIFKGNFLFNRKIWDIIVLILIFTMFIGNYLDSYLFI